jgi:predicted PurR-regulated permease PerM
VERFSPWDSFAELPSKHRKRVLLVVISTMIVLLFLYYARNSLFPFIISSVLSYILFPAVNLFERVIPWRARYPGVSRITAIAVIYVVGLAVIAGVSALIVPPAVRQSTDLLENLPNIYTEARQAIEDFTEDVSKDIPEDVRLQIEEYVAQFGDLLIQFVQTVLSRTLSTVANTLSFVIGLAIVPVLLFYLLKDGERMVGSFYGLFPESARGHCAYIVGMANKSLGAYIRAQLTLMLFVGLIVFIGLTALGIDFAVLLALTAGITEAIPVVGPLLGAVPGVLVALATAPDKIVWVLVLYIGTQLIENSFLVPRIQGNAVQMHPVLIMVLLIVASETFGVIGVLAAVPLASIARDVFRYLYQIWSDEPATTPLEKVAGPPAQSPA